MLHILIIVVSYYREGGPEGSGRGYELCRDCVGTEEGGVGGHLGDRAGGGVGRGEHTGLAVGGLG